MGFWKRTSDTAEGADTGKRVVSGRGWVAKIALLIGGLIVFFIVNPLVIIGAGQRGIVLTFGAVQPTILPEGLHIRIPIAQSIVKVDVQIHKSQVEADASSKDLQETHSVIAVNYHLQPEKVNWVYQNIGLAYKERIIDPAVQEVLKGVTAKHTAVDLINKREQVSMETKQHLKERLLPYAIIVDDFAILNFRFSPEFTRSIEAKQTAEQLALKAQNDLKRIQIEAEQKITSAKAEAESLRLQKENATDNLVRLRQVEASLKAIEKWNGKMPDVVGGAIPFIDVKSYTQSQK